MKKIILSLSVILIGLASCVNLDEKIFAPAYILSVISDNKENQLHNSNNSVSSRVSFSPAVFIYIDGEVVAYLNPESDDDLIKRFNSNNVITLLDATDMYFSIFEKDKDIFRFTPYAMLRLLIPHFDCFSGIVLYLDGDTLANNDISYAFDVDMEGYEMCVSKDLIHSEVINDGTMIFNTGVLLINVDYIRKTKCFDAAIQFYLKYRPDMIDQACLNATCKKIKRWHNDERFNYQCDGIQDDTIIKHFFYPMSYIEDLFYIEPDNIKKVQNLLNLHN